MYAGETEPNRTGSIVHIYLSRTLVEDSAMAMAMAMAEELCRSARTPPQVLLLPYTFQGHVSPMINLALKLASSFHVSVTFLTTHHCLFRLLRSANLTEASNLAEFLASNSVSEADAVSVYYLCRQLGLDSDSGIRFVGISDGFSIDYDRSITSVASVRSLDANLEKGIDEFLRNGRDVVDAASIACMISDSFMPYTQEIADRLGIPRVFFWTQSLAVFSAYSKMSALGYDPFEQEVTRRGQMDGFMVKDLPGLPPMDPYDLPFFAAVRSQEMSNWLSNQLHRQFSGINDAAWIFANSFDHLEGSTLLALTPSIPNLLLLGPLNVVHLIDGKNSETSCSLLRASIFPEDGHCLAWLDTKPPSSVLFISFGSVIPLSTEQITEISHALLNVCRDTEIFCLWVCRLWTKEKFPEEFWAELVESGRVMVVEWASQVEVLAHSAVGGFLSHAGWNSTVESVSMGVPMICSPLYLDQYTNSWSAVYRWKVGVELHLQKEERSEMKQQTLVLRRAEVEEAIKRLMIGGEAAELRQAAAATKAAARRAWGVSGSSLKNLESFVEYLFNRFEDKI